MLIESYAECTSDVLKGTRLEGVPSSGFFNDTATTEIYTLSLHDALPISYVWRRATPCCQRNGRKGSSTSPDRKSTRLNSSHANISYAVFCLKKKHSVIPPCY